MFFFKTMGCSCTSPLLGGGFLVVFWSGQPFNIVNHGAALRSTLLWVVSKKIENGRDGRVAETSTSRKDRSIM